MAETTNKLGPEWTAGAGTSDRPACPSGMDRIALASVAVVVAGLGACTHPAAPLSTALQAAPPTTAAPAAVTRRAVSTETDLHQAFMQRYASTFAPPCAELDLPPALRRSKPRSEAEEKNLGRGLAIFLPKGTVVAQRAGAREVAVYLSNLLDPSSEIGDAGYRVVVRDAQGNKKDASLGFAMFRPYVVDANDALPILDGETLQLAAEIRELDDDSISFPPIGLEAKRRVPHRMLRCPLAALFHDQDGDGATDVEEARLGTDPADPDTDGDGLPDGADPAPLGGTAPTILEDDIRLAVLQGPVDMEAVGELLVMVTDGPRLDLRGVRFRLLQLRKDELEAYRKRWGMRMPFTIKIKVEDANHAAVDVSYGWRGDRYAAKRIPATKDRWEFETKGGWISGVTPHGVPGASARSAGVRSPGSG